MKKRYAILLAAAMLWFLLWVQILDAAWNKNKPAATTGLNISNPLILGNFAALETAIGANHEFSTGGTNSGKHTTIVMEEQSSITTGANEMGLYCANLGTAPGLYLRPQSNGTAIQWSDIAGKIVNAAMADDSIDSDQYVDASIDLAHLSVNSIDSDQYVDNSIDPAHLVDDFTFDTFPLSPSSAPDADYELANKKYVDTKEDTLVTQATASIFGSWTNKDSGNSVALAKDEIYKVGSDGFVIAYTAQKTNVYIKGYTDGSNPPNTQRLYLEYQSTVGRGSITMPVRKDDYFELNTDATSLTIYWLPIGTGACVKQ